MIILKLLVQVITMETVIVLNKNRLIRQSNLEENFLPNTI